MSIRVWVDGERVDDKPSLSALDHGVTVGDGGFETCKVIDGQVFARTMHHTRFDRTLAGLGLPRADRDRVDEGIDAVLREPMPLGRVRYMVTGGAGPLGSGRLDSALTYIVTAGPADPPPVSSKIEVVPWVRNERGALAGLKTTSYAENVVALAYAKERGADEGIFANTRDELCEGTGSNIFAVVDGEILTPPLSAGPLAGIARALVLRWCKAAGLPIREATLPLDVLDRAEEIFLTSSLREVQGVHTVGSRTLTPGPVTARAAQVFADAAALDNDPAP
ncbi:aminotransferase class IV [Allobranchiibius sp. GilTou73]|uniref:aminotransferase class IV n=1 Tax=Allobranchiibius sp. GilTou73 TaxID=2904523 RepID=UPI001F41A980|nr:aminotransferase class IV [Allobranchiibius sp. GilTou73]UIJ33729.1 aminotransferase class IV [Allobranchiibius sp. GilTou73]